MAMILPINTDARPDNTLPGAQPKPPGGSSGEKPDNTLPGDIPRPENPIFYPLPPGAPPPQVDNTLPGSQPGVDNTLPGSQPGVDNTLPGSQPRPENPIVLPPDSGGWLPVYIDNTLPGEQPVIDNSLPLPPEGEMPEGKVDWRYAWTPNSGWIMIGVAQVQPRVAKPKKK
jgi:hypothetical protein